jgi:hypothetical protein
MVVNRTPKQTVDHPERGGKKRKKKKPGWRFQSSQWTLIENCSVPNLSTIQHRHSVKVISIQQLVTLASSIALRIEVAIIN